MNTLTIYTENKIPQKNTEMVCHNCVCKKYFQFKKGNKQGNKKEVIYHTLKNFLGWPAL